MNTPKVSVCVPTFNHQAYIAQMLDGALAQQTDFEFEIVVGDDASTDQTPAIVGQYAARFPGKIRAFLHPTNQGPPQPKEFAGRNNVLQLLKACAGQYVALCEGDDYWTDPLKLQKQADFMDKNPTCAICHHNLRVMYEDGSAAHDFNQSDQKIDSTLADVLADRWFIGTASTFYRNIFREQNFAHWHAKAASGDWALVLQLAATGGIHYLPQTMGVYRKHQGGLSNVHASDNVFFLKNRQQMFEDVNVWTDFRFDGIIKKTIEKYQNSIAELTQKRQ